MLESDVDTPVAGGFAPLPVRPVTVRPQRVPVRPPNSTRNNSILYYLHVNVALLHAYMSSSSVRGIASDRVDQASPGCSVVHCCWQFGEEVSRVFLQLFCERFSRGSN